MLDPAAVSLNLVETFEDAEEFMRWLGERRPVLACDTETGGLDWWKDRLRLVQFGDPRAGWAVPWQDWGGLVRETFRRYTGPLVFHNAKFDMHYLEREGCSPPRAACDDTAIMSHLIDPNGLHGLKPLGVRYVDTRLGAGQNDLHTWMVRNKYTWDTIPVDYAPYWSYAALDTVITACLHEKFTPLIETYREAYELDVAAQFAIMDMETRGARIDVEYCTRKRAELITYVDEMADWIKEEWGCGVGNTDAAARLLVDGVVLTEKTETGQWKMDAEVLAEIDHPLAAGLLKRRQAQKIANAYFKNLLGDRDGDIIHPDVKTLGARTGRMSVSRPALQQLPRGRLVRDAFIPREGNVMVDFDYDQLEARLTAHFSGDTGMIEAFAEADSGAGDFFTLLARRLTGNPNLQKEAKERQDTKQACYGTIYGAGVATFARRAGVEIGPAQLFLDSYYAAFPKIKELQHGVQTLAKRRLAEEGVPYIFTPWGRRLTGDEDTIYALVNYLIQGTAADLFKQKVVDLDNAGLLGYAVLPVHDELLFDVPKEEAEDLVHEVEAVMGETERFLVPLTCSGSVGATWGEVH